MPPLHASCALATTHRTNYACFARTSHRSQVYELLSPRRASLCRKVDVVTVKGSKAPMTLYTYDIALDVANVRAAIALTERWVDTQRHWKSSCAAAADNEVSGEEANLLYRDKVDACTRCYLPVHTCKIACLHLRYLLRAIRCITARGVVRLVDASTKLCYYTTAWTLTPPYCAFVDVSRSCRGYLLSSPRRHA